MPQQQGLANACTHASFFKYVPIFKRFLKLHPQRNGSGGWGLQSWADPGRPIPPASLGRASAGAISQLIIHYEAKIVLPLPRSEINCSGCKWLLCPHPQGPRTNYLGELIDTRFKWPNLAGFPSLSCHISKNGDICTNPLIIFLLFIEAQDTDRKCASHKSAAQLWIFKKQTDLWKQHPNEEREPHQHLWSPPRLLTTHLPHPE